MKRLGWGMLAFITSVVMTIPVNAIEAVPTTPSKLNGPLLITAYSFSGQQLRYIQLFNNSSALISLDGWQISTATKTVPIVTTNYISMSGYMEPGKHAVAAVSGLVDNPTFVLPSLNQSLTPLVGTVSLLAPSQSGLNDEVATVPTITSSTMKEVIGAQANYYIKRDVSTTTGNYLSGFMFMLPIETIKNDELYAPPISPMLQIVEIFPDAPVCSPFDTTVTCADYVKIYNASTTPIDLSVFRLRTGVYGQAASTSNSRTLSGTLEGGQYTSFPLSLSGSGSWVWIEDIYGTTRYETTTIKYPSSADHDSQSWAYDEQSGAWRWSSIPTPENTRNVFPEAPEVNYCSALRLTEVAANVATEDQFIEVRNDSTEPITLSGCMVQTNRSSTASYVFADTVVLAGAYVTLYIKDTPLTLTKTTTGSVYLLSSDGSTEADSVTYADLLEDTSYAFFGDSWQQTFVVTPAENNILQEYAHCEVGSVRNPESGLCNKITTMANSLADCGEGKYRSDETNRCRVIETTSSLAPCDNDQYRSPETNRCRNLVTTASMLTPCASNQERNPDTNRCRNITSVDGLTPCAANQERNPETNRCRLSASSVAADFPVEAVAQTGQATLGWWAFGGVGLLAAGYAGWEWRRELIKLIRTIVPFGIGRP